MRHKILQNELTSSEESLASQVKRRLAVRRTTSVLSSERREALAKIRELEAELELIGRHEREQGEKEEAIAKEEAETVARIGLVRGTLKGLEGDLEKKRMLVVGVGGVVEEDGGAEEDGRDGGRGEEKEGPRREEAKREESEEDVFRRIAARVESTEAKGY